METWLSGRKRLTANEVWALNPIQGSNPCVSAKKYLDGYESISKINYGKYKFKTNDDGKIL
jgi:hypothetical protein